jgi:serine/threonine-protein kinase
MTPERWKKIEDIFSQAIELPKTERSSFVQLSCGNDAELLNEVESLLKQDSGTGTLFATAISKAAGSLSQDDIKSFEGRRIGPYRIIGLIGEGGMAEVYRAVRDDDQYQKQVAIKLIRSNIGTAFLVKRFQQERQILASLEHPCIARFLEGGTQDGIPYLVMEFIEGEPITAYCKTRDLSIRERLQLFRSVCDAVQYAHRNLVIHRDLKPNNILVTSDGVPKLLDFGIAKLLNPEEITETSNVAHTVTSIRIMTPEYASPEQVRGETVTTSTDIYSLGAILYEMLTGSRPREFKTKSLVGIERIVTEEELQKPSSVVAKNLTTDPTGPIANTKKLTRELSGDLDNIVMMAMQKEPQRRYLSAEQFGQDINNYLQGRPVQARTPTLAYRTAKFIRRHKIGVAVTAAFLIFAVIFVIGIMRERTRAEEARIRAEREAARAIAVSEFLQRTLASANPFNLGKDVSMVDALKSASNEIGKSFKNEPETEADVRDTVGFTFLKLGNFEEAEKHLTRALEIRKKLYSSDHRDTAETLDNLGTMYQEKGDLAKAEKFFRDALTMRKKVLPKDAPQIANSLNNLSNVLNENGRIDEAERVQREALAIRHKIDDPEKLATSLNNLGAILIDKREFTEAESLLRQVLEHDRKTYGENHINFAYTLNNIAYVTEQSGRIAEAEPIYKRVYEMMPKLMGEEHIITTRSAHNYGSILLKVGKLDTAEPILRKGLETQKRILAPDHYQIAISETTLAQVLIATNRCNEAEPMLREAIAIFAKSNYDPAQKSISKGYLGECLTTMKRFPEAEKVLIESRSELAALKPQHESEIKRAEQRLTRLNEARKN